MPRPSAAVAADHARYAAARGQGQGPLGGLAGINCAGSIVSGGWARRRCGRFTDLDLIAGKRELLLGKLQELYGLKQQSKERELRDWERHQEPIAPAMP